MSFQISKFIRIIIVSLIFQIFVFSAILNAENTITLAVDKTMGIVYNPGWVTQEVIVPSYSSEEDMEKMAKKQRIETTYGERLEIGLGTDGMFIGGGIFPKDGDKKFIYGPGGSFGFVLNYRILDPKVDVVDMGAISGTNQHKYRTTLYPDGAHSLYLSFGIGATALGLMDLDQNPVSMTLGATGIIGLKYDYVWFNGLREEAKRKISVGIGFIAGYGGILPGEEGDENDIQPAGILGCYLSIGSSF